MDKKAILEEINQVQDLFVLDNVYDKYLGRRGELTEVLRSLKNLSEKEKAEKGKEVNILKKELEEAIKNKKEELAKKESAEKEWIDVTLPGKKPTEGHLHPITLVRRQIEEIFQSMGFAVIDGPEVETEYYNFDVLNIPQDHPARDMWDTFWIKGMKNLLRTHTSPVQARYMEEHNPPLRIIAPGRVFRHEATDASHNAEFNQVEGLMVGKDISVANFRAIIEEFLKIFFDSEIETRLRPSYFPFTEPSFEIDMRKKGREWLEIMGAGMVHPNVFKAVKYGSGKWQGFAFGMGIDRLAMLKYNIGDIRLLNSGDLRFIRQF